MTDARTDHTIDTYTGEYSLALRPASEVTEGETYRLPADDEADGREWSDFSLLMRRAGLRGAYSHTSEDRWDHYTLVRDEEAGDDDDDNDTDKD